MDYISLIYFGIILVIILIFYLIKYFRSDRNNENNSYLLQEDEDDLADQLEENNESLDDNGIEINQNCIIDINTDQSRDEYIEYEYTLDEECPICLDTMLNTKIIQTKCMHKYHTKCIKEWYNKRKNNIICPECGF